MAVSPADSSPLPLRKSLFAAPPQLFPGLSCTYRVPLTSGSQSVFSTGWCLQEGLEGGLSRTHCSAALASLHDPATLSQGDLSSRGQAGSTLLPSEGLPLRHSFWTHGRRAHELHSLGYVPFLSLPPTPPFFFWQNLRQIENLCSGKGRYDVS